MHSTPTALNGSDRDGAHCTDSARETLTGLAARYPGRPLLALGQTALWDEPTKATVRRLLDNLAPDTEMVVGAHDTDYFAKAPGHPSNAGDADYAIVTHDDAATRGLWSAAGEMSRLFGSEDLPTRHELETRCGISFRKALAAEGDPQATLAELTEAWGWSGIIYTRWDKKIAGDIPLADVLPALKAQISATMGASAALLKDADRAAQAASVTETVLGWVDGFARDHSAATLTDLYRDLLPRFYALLLGETPAHLTTTTTRELLRFNTQTACLPRFEFVDLFLNPATRKPAIAAYDLAVGGSGAYTLASFGEGALPFDIVLPGKGRGTLAILPDGMVQVMTSPRPITICPPGESCVPTSVEELAALLERQIGPDVTLVGKAVTLLPMLAAEYIFVFHEGASGYTDRTAAMLAEMRRRRLPVPDVSAILRVKYATWDALSAVPVKDGDLGDGMALPPHLSQTMGRASIGFDDWALCWRRAVTLAERDLNTLRELRSPRHLLEYLEEEHGGDWRELSRDYAAARLKLLGLRDRTQAMQGRVYTFYDQVRRLKTEVQRLEHEKGDDFRANIQPLRERIAAAKDPAEAEQAAAAIETLQSERMVRYDVEIESRLGMVRYALATVRELKQSRLALERSEEAVQARETLQQIEALAELARARLAANSLRTLHALPHINSRPSAWWFPLVDGTGRWFDRLAETAELYWEEL